MKLNIGLRNSFVAGNRPVGIPLIWSTPVMTTTEIAEAVDHRRSGQVKRRGQTRSSLLPTQKVALLFPLPETANSESSGHHYVERSTWRVVDLFPVRFLRSGIHADVGTSAQKEGLCKNGSHPKDPLRMHSFRSILEFDARTALPEAANRTTSAVAVA